MNYLYKLATTENVEINYNAFNKKEFIECLATMRDIYFRLKQENQQLKEIINAAKTRISIIRMDNDTTEDIHKALDYILKILLKGVQE